MEDIYTTSTGQMERMFYRHNKQVWRESPRDKIKALPFHLAVELVTEGLWDKAKKHLIVALPRIKKNDLIFN